MQDPGDLTVGQALDVGHEVGIAPDSILLGMAEERLPDAGDRRLREDSPLWQRALVEIRDALEVSVRLPLAPDAALSLVDDVMDRDAYQMTLEDRIADGERGASVSVFRRMHGKLFEHSSLHSALELSDGRVLAVAITPDLHGGSRLRLRIPLYERNTNLMLGSVTGIGGGVGGLGLGASGGGAVAGSVLAGSAGILPVLAVAIPAVAGAYLGLGVGLLAFRRLQKWGFKQGETALRQLARFLETEAARSLGSGA